jgi:hypothetical protein
MTATKNTKNTKSPATKGALVVVQTNPATRNITGAIATWGASASKRTDARNALVAYALNSGIKASVIVAESNGTLDAPEVSRINKFVKAFDTKRVASVKRWGAPTDADVTDETSIATWAKRGEAFRRIRVTKGTATDGTKNETAATRTTIDKDSGVTVNTDAKPAQIVTDAVSAILDVLAVASDDDRAAWFAMIADTLTPENADARKAQLAA